MDTNDTIQGKTQLTSVNPPFSSAGIKFTHTSVCWSPQRPAAKTLCLKELQIMRSMDVSVAAAGNNTSEGEGISSSNPLF